MGNNGNLFDFSFEWKDWNATHARTIWSTLELPWTKLKAPELTNDLIEKMVSGTSEQAGEKSVKKELEKLRDECLIEILQALKNSMPGTGKYIQS